MIYLYQSVILLLQKKRFRRLQVQLKMLLVEDDLDLLQMVGSVVEKLNYEVFKVDTVDKAIEFLKENSPDVIVSDYYLNKESAWSLHKYLRETLQQNTPFIVITGYDVSSEMQSMLEDENTDIIHKPFGKKELEQVLEKKKK